MTPLGVAIERGHADVASNLLECGAKLDVLDSQGRTVLFTACSSKRLDLVQLLVTHKASLDIKDSCGRSPLDLARRVNAHDIVEYLSRFSKP